MDFRAANEGEGELIVVGVKIKGEVRETVELWESEEEGMFEMGYFDGGRV